MKYVEALLSLRDKYKAIIDEAFEGDTSFLNALNEARVVCERQRAELRVHLALSTTSCGAG